MEIKMTNAKQNPIANITETLVGNAKARQAKKPSKPVVTLGTESALKAIQSYTSGVSARDNSVSLMNLGLKPFHDAKVKLVKLSEKSKANTPEYKFTQFVSKSFIDSIKAMTNPATGKAYPEATAKQYYKTFSGAVNSGKPIEYADANKNKKGGKPKEDGLTTEQAIKAFNNALLKVWELSDLNEKGLTKLDGLLDTEGSLINAITAYLKAEDFNLPE
jgi:hypothetical protein